jgi:hypothetical protein
MKNICDNEALNGLFLCVEDALFRADNFYNDVPIVTVFKYLNILFYLIHKLINHVRKD